LQEAGRAAGRSPWRGSVSSGSMRAPGFLSWICCYVCHFGPAFFVCILAQSDARSLFSQSNKKKEAHPSSNKIAVHPAIHVKITLVRSSWVSVIRTARERGNSHQIIIASAQHCIMNLTSTLCFSIMLQ
jgi:hypothetical protein